ncbi:sigma-70 family RNA polymerase sigma factor [Haloactinopolyspora alba]|nr:RNA polymerase subunit sigma-70 [Haloactinopolyspora alba]
MSDERCQVCGGPLPARSERRGRSSLYCSPACRQKAYRSRRTSATGDVHELIAEVERRVRALEPRVPDTFYGDVTDLSSSVGRLRRIARVARDAAAGGTGDADSVTPTSVTETGETAGDEAATMLSGDEWAFAGLVEQYRRELQVHCYRMVGSYDDSDDLVQETLLRAWRNRDGFEGRSTVRAWLYRIATNACLDFLRRTKRQPERYEPVPGIDSGHGDPPPKVTWLQPYPEEALSQLSTAEAQPDDVAESRETIELAFLVAIQHLPPKQRAVLILRDVLDWSAVDTAALLEMSVASVNSALQRARPTMREYLPKHGAGVDWSGVTRPTGTEREVLQRYIDASDRADISAMADLLSPDVVLTMPPNPFWFVSRDAMVSFITPSADPASPQFLGDWWHVPTVANSMPAAAGYVRRPGTAVYRAQVLDVLRIVDGAVVEITAFEPHLFPAFGLPMKLSDPPSSR